MPATAHEPGTALSGIFSNVYRSPETNDVQGLEIEFHSQARAPFAFVVFCEGGCGQVHRVSVKLKGNRFSLAFTENLFDSSGRADGLDRYRIEGRRVGRSLVGEFQMNSFRDHFRLTRRAKRFGLAVANLPAH
jgi:hypothetical protein